MPAKQVQGDGIDGGEAAGLAFGMLFLGMVLAGVGIFVMNKRRSAPVPYTRNLARTEGGE